MNDSMERLMNYMLHSGSGDLKNNELAYLKKPIVTPFSSARNSHVPDSNKSERIKYNQRSNMKLSKADYNVR